MKKKSNSPFQTLKMSYDELRKRGWSKRESLSMLLDMIHCRLHFHILPEEYLLYDLMYMKDRKRKYFLTAYTKSTLYRKGMPADFKPFRNKEYQQELFSDFAGRRSLHINAVSFDELCDFVFSHERVFFKPCNSSLGNGAFVFETERGVDALKETLALIEGREYLCEEYIVQHPALASLHPQSVNTVRLMTLCDGKAVKPIVAMLRMGGGKSRCDNISKGGYGAKVDVESGIVCTAARDFKGDSYYIHPDTKQQIIGFNLPFWKEAKEMVTAAALRISQFAVIGWDISFTEKGPILVEFNVFPDPRIQIHEKQPCGEEIIKHLKNQSKK